MLALGVGIGIPFESSSDSAFSPSKLFSAGEKGVWLDPSDLSTLFQDSGATTPVTTPGDPIGYIADKSGNTRNATQSVSISRPTYQSRNGSGVARFDGTTSAVATPTIDLTGTSKATLIVGEYLISNAAAAVMAELSVSSGINPGTFYYVHRESSVGDTSIKLIGASSVGGRRITDTKAVPFAQVTSIVFDFTAGGTPTLDISPRINAAIPSFIANDPSVGAGPFGNNSLYLGGRGGASLFTNVDLFGFILIGRALTASEIASAETWMNSRAGAY